MAGIDEKKAAFQELERRGKFNDLAPEKMAAVTELRTRLFGEQVTIPQAVVRGGAKVPLVREAAATFIGAGEQLGQRAGQAFEKGKQIFGIEPKRDLPRVPSFAESVASAREDITGKVERAQEQRPISTTVGEFGTVAAGGVRAIPAVAKTLAPLGVGKVIGALAGSTALGAATSGERPGEEKAVNEFMGALFSPESILEGAASGAVFGAGGEGLSRAVKGGAKLAGRAGTRVLASLRGISPDSIRTFAAKPAAVSKIIKQKVVEFVPAWADDATEQLRNWVGQRTATVRNTLASIDQPINISSLKQSAQKSVDSIGQLKSTPGKVRQMGRLRRQVKLLQDLPDDLSAVQLQQLKQDLQEEAFEIFVDKGFRTSPAHDAVESIAKKAQTILEELGPEIADANGELSKAIRLQKALKIKNLFKADGGIDEGLARRLLVSNKPEDIKRLKELQALTGIDFADSKEAFKAAKDLGSEDLFSSLFTGRSLGALMIGEALGQAGGVAGIGGVAGAVAGSPAITRPLIRAGKAAGGLAGALTPARISATGQAIREAR
jgi:hypothetical protein